MKNKARRKMTVKKVKMRQMTMMMMMRSCQMDTILVKKFKV